MVWVRCRLIDVIMKAYDDFSYTHRSNFMLRPTSRCATAACVHERPSGDCSDVKVLNQWRFKSTNRSAVVQTLPCTPSFQQDMNSDLDT